MFLSILCGVSYATYNLVYVSPSVNKIAANGARLEFLECNTEVINIEGEISLTDNEGLNQKDKFDFAVILETNETTDISYSVILEKLSVLNGKTALKDDEIKIYLENKETKDVVLNPILVSNISSDYILTKNIHSHSSSKNKIVTKYTLKAWIDQDAEDKYNWNEETNLQYKFKIGIKTNYEESNTPSSDTYTVTYNANGGTGTMTSDTFKYNQTYTLKQNTFTKEGSLFLGWSTAQSAKTPKYTDKASVKNLSETYHNNVTLYAVWDNQLRTVLYNDGTQIINELGKDRVTNQTKHGSVKNTYAPLDSTNSYVMINENSQPSAAQRESITGLENWDTSSLKNTREMFRGAGHYETGFTLDLSNWDLSHVTNASNMFDGAGKNSDPTWKVTIPQKTLTNNNTTTKWYGVNSTVYAEPGYGKLFTLAN